LIGNLKKKEPIKGDRFLHEVVLSSNELDKFKNKKMYEAQGFKIQAVFVSDPYYDKHYFD